MDMEKSDNNNISETEKGKKTEKEKKKSKKDSKKKEKEEVLTILSISNKSCKDENIGIASCDSYVNIRTSLAPKIQRHNSLSFAIFSSLLTTYIL